MSECGDIVMLKELVGEEGNKRCDTTVRVTGEVCFINAVNRVCQICMDNASLFVDLSTVSMSGLAVGSLFQFIGRLQSTERKDCDLQLDPMPAMYLVATVKRNVDGLDLALYKKALQLRRGRLQNS